MRTWHLAQAGEWAPGIEPLFRVLNVAVSYVSVYCGEIPE